MAKTYSCKFLKEAVEGILVKNGASPLIAADTAWSMLQTSLRGIDTHGIAMLPKILSRVEKGRSQLKKEAEVVTKTNNLPVAVMEAHLSPGQHACLAAARLAASKAEKYGIGLVAVRNSTHFGASCPYLVEILKKRFVGIVGSNSLRSMAAFGLRQANLGNNPLGFAAPLDGGEDFIFDSSCAVMSFGRRNVLKREGKPVPEGAFVKAEKADENSGVCEIADSLEELAVPFGDYKGASIAVMIEVLSGLLASGYVGEKTEIIEGGEYHGQSQFALAVNPATFDVKDFDRKCFDYINAIRRNNKSVRLPGDSNNATLKERTEKGIPVADHLFDEFKKWTDKCKAGINWDSP